MLRTTLPLTLLALSACASVATKEVSTPVDPWSAEFVPPETLDTARMHLEPLRAELAQLDFDAAMGSREHLRRTLQWGGWPGDDMTVDKNRGDLVRHWNEFEAREAYAYSVLTPDRSKCLGCVYMRPTQAEGIHEPAVEVAFWVVEDQLEHDLDAHLIQSLLAWVTAEWPFDSMLFGIHQDDGRGNNIALEAGLENRGTARSRVTWAWWRW